MFVNLASLLGKTGARQDSCPMSHAAVGGLLGCNLEAATSKGSLFHGSILLSYGLERAIFADFS